ncbi:MAG TPA: SDR family oxidoreductase [Thermoleophilaceae bacterium]|jgi:NAD(P)-dependent dehydrogenase (short-subunit alcohol dehydrogenase family)|nr:SDR family oxidoreductase [Thermoleophilaceae bacterium]
MAAEVLVAGGTGALGAAVVKELVASGFPVGATWLVEEERERLQGLDVELIKADLFNREQAAEAVAAISEIGAVVNLVGGYAESGRVHETDPDEFDRLMRLNLRPNILLARAAIPRFLRRGGGAFVGVSARPALRPFPGAAPYIVAKAAVLSFVQTLDAEYRQDGIRANAVLPSVIDTPANRRAQPDADYSKWVTPEEIAKVIRFLVSDDSAPTSGAAIPVYGKA